MSPYRFFAPVENSPLTILREYILSIIIVTFCDIIPILFALNFQIFVVVSKYYIINL